MQPGHSGHCKDLSPPPEGPGSFQDFGSFWPIFRQARIFSINFAPPVVITYAPSTSCKIWDKSNEPVLRKNAAKIGKLINQTILGLFGPLLKKEFLKKNWLCQFWVFIVPTSCKVYKKTNKPVLKKSLL